MLHVLNHCLQFFTTLRDWATPIDTPNICQMVIHTDRRSFAFTEHIYCNKKPQISEISEIIPEAEDEIIAGQALSFFVLDS